MSNRNHEIDKKISAQMELFSEGLSPGSLEHISLGVKQRMSKMLHGHDRHIVAAVIGVATGLEVKGSTFEKILSSDMGYQPSIVQVVAACKFAGKLDPLEFAVTELGGEIVMPEDMKYLKLARLEEKRRQLEQEIQLTRAQCGIK